MMKKILAILAVAAAFAGCTRKYELNTEFTIPTALDGVEAVTLDVTSGQTVEFSWTGGSAADGGIVLYTVMFDTPDGDFSNPVDVRPADLGAGSTLTLSHAELNTIARKAGIKVESTGTLKWTVTASRGGVVRPSGLQKNITLTRGEGIDNFPKSLYLKGSGSLGPGETEGREFRVSEEGVYVIYTKLADGEIYFASDAETASTYYSKDGKLNEGVGVESTKLSGIGEVTRLTVNFNTLSVKSEIISGVRVAFATGKFFSDMVLDNDVLSYKGGGVYFSSVACDHFFHGWDWCAAPDAGEERYTIYVEVDGNELEWGVTDSKYGASRPKLNYGVEYFELKEYTHGRPDWGNNVSTFKFPSECEHACFDITLYTNKDNRWYHQFSNFSEYVPGGKSPEELDVPSSVTLRGMGSDMDGLRLNDLGGGIFEIPVVAFNGANIYLDGGSHTYYISGSRIRQGDNMAGVSATPAGKAERVILNFNDGSVVRKTIEEVAMVKAARVETYPNGVLTYQGNGVYLAKGVECTFTDMGGWWDERYSFYVTIGEDKYTWGRTDTGDAENRPVVVDGKFSRPLQEFAGQGQWDHLWKLATECDKSSFTVTLVYDGEGFCHEVSNIKSMEDSPIPSSLTVSGAGAEISGEKCRKLDEGVFELFCTSFNGGAVGFNGPGRSYFLDGNRIKEGSPAAIAATPSGEAERVVLDFNTMTAERIAINDVRVCLSAPSLHTITNGTMTYIPSEHKWRAENCKAEFYRGWDWCAALGEERYVICLKVGGKEYQWGHPGDPSAEVRPSDRAVIRKLAEFDETRTDQWNHCYKMHADCETNSFTAEIWFNDNIDIWHQFKDFK